VLKINKKVEYALMALKFMSDKPDISALVSAREICDTFETPFDTTAKVMQIMNNHSILKSVKGIKGGYSLNKSLKEVSYLELVQMIEERTEIGNVCTNHKGTCELIGKCNITTPIENLNRKLNIFLLNLSLSDLLLSTEFNINTNEHINNEVQI
jgi:Rrf2 family protein